LQRVGRSSPFKSHRRRSLTEPVLRLLVSYVQPAVKTYGIAQRTSRAGAQGRRGAGAQGRRGAGAQGRRGAGAQGGSSPFNSEVPVRLLANLPQLKSFLGRSSCSPLINKGTIEGAAYDTPSAMTSGCSVAGRGDQLIGENRLAVLLAKAHPNYSKQLCFLRCPPADQEDLPRASLFPSRLYMTHLHSFVRMSLPMFFNS